MDGWLWTRNSPSQQELDDAARRSRRATYALDRRYFDQYCQEARMELELLVDADVLRGRVYHALLEVITRTFITFAEGHCDANAVVAWVHQAVAGMRDHPPAAVLGCELAKAGFLAMHQPELALHYAALAALILDQINQQSEHGQAPHRLLPPDR